MEPSSETHRLDEAANRLQQKAGLKNAPAIVSSLNLGLSMLTAMLYDRLHQDVEKLMGTDSFLMPVSEAKTRKQTYTQIEIFNAAESAMAGSEAGYHHLGPAWHAHWLADLWLTPQAVTGPIADRLDDYLALSTDARRLAFSDVLAKTLPESRRAPLVVFRLVPLAVHLATALAFGDTTRATQIRRQQADLLPAIADCVECRAKVLENGRHCRRCGNPLWKGELLNQAD